VLLDPASTDHHSPSWSPDGRWIAYQRLFEGGWQIAKAPAGGGAPVRLAPGNPGGGPQTAWSPTGEWIAYRRQASLRLVSADGTREKELATSPAPAFGFARDGTLLLAVRQGDGGWELASFDVATGALRTTRPLPVPREATFAGFSLHPDGETFATSIDLARFDTWLLSGLTQPRHWLTRLLAWEP
jgi:Tol biopolymer transport system component